MSALVEPQTQEAPQPESPLPPSVAAAPAELELGDGSRLVLDDAGGSPIVCRIESDRVSLSEAMSRAGGPFSGYRHLR